jgi:transcriptional regulator GlxA family with amidase domain
VEFNVGMFLSPSFSMLSYITASETLRTIDNFSREIQYKCEILSSDGKPVVASNGRIQPVDAGIEKVSNLSLVIVFGPFSPQFVKNVKVNCWLRSLASMGNEICAVGSGSYVLAQAGILYDHTCTTHWQIIPGLKMAFPKLNVTTKVFEYDRGVRTCAGGNAVIDMILDLVRKKESTKIANSVAEYMILGDIRDSNVEQKKCLRQKTVTNSEYLIECIELMEANIEQPLLISELAQLIGISGRQIERLFNRDIGQTPRDYYNEIRLQESRRLLSQTSLKIIDVASYSGYRSPSHFCSSYRNYFGRTPSDERKASRFR